MNVQDKTKQLLDYHRGWNEHPDHEERKVNPHDREEFEKAEKLATELCDLLNSGSKKVSMLGLLSGLRRSHRYLQNKAVWTLLEALGRLPDVESTDGRNEAGLEACRKVRTVLEENIYWEGL